MKTLGIIGAGELGQQIAHYAITDNHFNKIIFFDDFTQQEFVNGHPVIGGVDCLSEFYEKGKFSALMIGVGYKHMELRRELFERFRSLNIPFARIIHSTSYVDTTANILDGSIIYPMCTIDKNVIVEQNVLINNNVVLSHDSIIGAHSFISPACSLAGFVSVGNLSSLGINTIIIDSIKIAPNVQTGAGTIIIKDILTKGLYVGNPARFIR